MITPFYLESKASRPHLRVAVLLDGPMVPRYAATILGDIGRCNFARVGLCILPSAVGTHPTSGPADLARRLARSARAHALTFELYTLVDRSIGGAEDPLGLVDVSAWLSGVDRLEVPPATEDGRLSLPADAIAELERREVDVILRLCSALPYGDVLHVARHGVWSYHHGAEALPRGGPPFFRETADGAPTLEVLLEVLEDEPGAGLLLCRSSFSPRAGVFVAVQREAPIWETTHFILWKLHELHELGWDHVEEHALSRGPATMRRSLPTRPPTGGEMARFLVPRLVTGFTRRLSKRSRPFAHWQIGLRRTSNPLTGAPGATRMEGVRWLEATRGHYYADPFLIEREGKTFLFFEDYLYDRSFAVISRAEVLSDGSLGPALPCLDTGHHLSFPYVFVHDGEVFMMPESQSSGSVALYRARRFPDEWVEEKVLFRGNAVDTAVVHEGGRFYFFATLFDRDSRGMTTMLFVADSLTGAWRLHPASPVSSDVRNARGAGAVFRRGGRLFRPSQDCGVRYGYGFRLNEILTLSEERYEERLWCAIDPTSVAIRCDGVHTYNQCGDFEAIDSCLLGREGEFA
jgi:hypothetical protein